jgi:hypothetical protein
MRTIACALLLAVGVGLFLGGSLYERFLGKDSGVAKQQTPAPVE